LKRFILFLDYFRPLHTLPLHTLPKHTPLQHTPLQQLLLAPHTALQLLLLPSLPL